jgi:ElaB/YqjD/DUF883 family membrane-anchored ribosome-binding protein
MTRTALYKRDLQRQILLEEAEASRQALNKTIAGLKNNLKLSNLVSEISRPIVAQTNEAVESTKIFVTANPLLSLSATAGTILALNASAKSYRKSNTSSHGSSSNVSPRVSPRGFSSYLGRFSDHVLDRASGVSRNVVQEAAKVVKSHINDQTNSAESAALSFVRGITQTAVAAAETMLLATIANSLRARTKYTRTNNRRDGDDEY